MKYKILYDKNPAMLSMAVNNHIACGWTPWGNLHVSVGLEFPYSQVMWLEGEDDNGSEETRRESLCEGESTSETSSEGQREDVQDVQETDE